MWVPMTTWQVALFLLMFIERVFNGRCYSRQYGNSATQSSQSNPLFILRDQRIAEVLQLVVAVGLRSYGLLLRK